MFSIYSTLVLALALAIPASTVAAGVDKLSPSALSLFPEKGKGDSSGMGAEKVGAAAPEQMQGDSGDGFYYLYSNDGNNATYNNGTGGHFDVEWSGNSLLLAGMGYEDGDPNRIAKYSGTLDLQRRASFALTGVMLNQTMIYNVVEFVHEATHDYGDEIGSVDCDGSHYVITHYTVQGDNGQMDKYFSTRTNKVPRNGEVSGTITLSCHFAAWTPLGLKVGDHDGQLFIVQGSASRRRHTKGTAGRASITIS